VKKNAADHTAGTARDAPPTPLKLVVGFDGSDPAVRALEEAGRLIRGRHGSIHVIYVAHTPSTDGLSADAVAELEAGFDDLERTLSRDTRAHLVDVEERWTFQRRNGDVARELIGTASELRNHEGIRAHTMIVVGSSTHKAHRLVGSVPVALARHANVPLLVVP